jgi:hypothetical protein
MRGPSRDEARLLLGHSTRVMVRIQVQISEHYMHAFCMRYSFSMLPMEDNCNETSLSDSMQPCLLFQNSRETLFAQFVTRQKIPPRSAISSMMYHSISSCQKNSATVVCHRNIRAKVSSYSRNSRVARLWPSPLHEARVFRGCIWSKAAPS